MIKLTALESSIILPLQDTNGDLQAWVDAHYATELMSIMAPPSGIYTRRGSNLPFPNYGQLPSPKINQLVLPTGAARWGYTLLLATEAQKDLIYAAQNLNAGMMTLHWSAPLVGDMDAGGNAVNETVSDTNRTVKLLVHCLPPRAITPRGRLLDTGLLALPGVSRRIENMEMSGYPVASDLYLIPVVDARYFLQFLDVGAMSGQDFTSDEGPFADVFDAGTNKSSAEKIYIYLESLIPSDLYPSDMNGFVKCDDISPEYVTPPTWTSENDYENLGVVLDAFCWQHGLAFVPVVSQSYTSDGSLSQEYYPFAIVSVDESSVLYRGNPAETTSQRGAIRGYGGIGKSTRNASLSSGVFSSHYGGRKFCGLPILVAGGDNYRLIAVGPRVGIMEGGSLPANIRIKNGESYATEAPPASFEKWPATRFLPSLPSVLAPKTQSGTIATIRWEWSDTLSAAELDQIASDYYYRFLWQFDYTFLGVQPWQQSAYDDYTVYSMAQHAGQYVCHTRAVSLPLNTLADVVSAGSSGGGESHHIWFIIQDVVCHADDSMTLSVLPTWYTGGCNGTIPGEDSYGEVEVIDPCNILSLYTVEFLEAGAMGRATYMYPVGETGSYCDGEWILDTICGQPECA